MTTVHDIAAAFDDPALFGDHFSAPGWAAWRAFVRALTGAPLDAAQLAIFQECTGRTTAPTEAFTEAALVVGRRGGKSRTLGFLAAAMATLRNYEPHLSAGEVATVMVLAQTTKQARNIFRYVNGFLKSVPTLAAMIEREDVETIVLNNRTQIEIASANFRSTRGYTLAGVLADETAFWRDETSANPDVEILRALRPALGTIPGAMLLMASSPYGKSGELYAIFRRYYGHDDADVLVWQAPTLRMHPSRHLEKARARDMEADPEAARAEWDAQFRDDLADYLTREAIDGVTAWGRTEQPPIPGTQYHAFADPSGGSNDSFTLAVAHQEGDLGVLDALLEIRPPFDPDDAVAHCAALLKRYSVSRVVGDHYAGLWPVARFDAHGITFEQSARGKSDLYGDFLPLANAGRVELLDIPRLASQFVALQRRTGRSGKDSIAEPKGAHDDVCNAVAGVLVGLDLDRRPALVSQNQLLTPEGKPAEIPRQCAALFAVLASDATGSTATTYWAYWPYASQESPTKLWLLDFHIAPLSAGLYDAISARVAELAQQCPSNNQVLYCTAEPLVRQAMARNIDAELVPDLLLADPVRLALSAAGHAMAGAIKITRPAHVRSEAAPMRGALDLRGGEAADASPLRLSLLAGIAVALDDGTQQRRAA